MPPSMISNHLDICLEIGLASCGWEWSRGMSRAQPVLHAVAKYHLDICAENSLTSRGKEWFQRMRRDQFYIIGISEFRLPNNIDASKTHDKLRKNLSQREDGD